MSCIHHFVGGDFRDQRHTKQQKQFAGTQQTMHGGKKRGLDYTPLFKFLLSKVGTQWNDVYSEAIQRLDRTEPIFGLVALHEHEQRDYVRIGESSYYSGLFVDQDGTLQIVNPSVSPSSLAPACQCCTHTLNGFRFTQP
jgi:hypothetical protein